MFTTGGGLRIVADSALGDTSVLHGWFPVVVQLIASMALMAAVGLRTRRWWMRRAPLAALVAVAAVLAVQWYVATEGLADDPAPQPLRIWIGLTAFSIALVVLGWQGAHWARRAASVVAVPLCVLCLLVSLNFWAGYVQTVDSAWNFFTRGELPNQADLATVTAMQASGQVPAKGRVVQVTIPADASRFKHRGELVYLPPVWFAMKPPAKLPVVMMIGGEFGSSADWIRAGGATTTIDAFAADHGGNAPVLVFVDKGGLINKDTECVNGPRGNAADHLTKDVVPYMISHFGVSPSPANWGAVGWSAGGTCAADLVVMHPDTFSTFVDIAGDLGPNAGTKAETIERLFAGDAHAWATFDPTAVMTRHDSYTGVAGWFAVAGPPADDGQTAGAGGLRPDSHTRAADSLCATGRKKGIECAVVPYPGKHDWLFATGVFQDALPWLAGRLGTPRVAEVALPEDRPTHETP